MKKSVSKMVDEVRSDESLTPYFVDYIGENVKMNIAKNLNPERSEIAFTETADSKLSALVEKLAVKVPKQHTNEVLSEVCRYYAGLVFLTRT